MKKTNDLIILADSMTEKYDIAKTAQVKDALSMALMDCLMDIHKYLQDPRLSALYEEPAIKHKIKEVISVMQQLVMQLNGPTLPIK
jgi:hypothetical protein